MHSALYPVPYLIAWQHALAEPAAGIFYNANAASDHIIVAAPGTVAADRGASRAQIALASLRRNPVVAAPILGALKTSHIDDAIAALAITLTDDEVARLENPYTPRRDIQGISDPAVLARMATQVGLKPAAARSRLWRAASQCCADAVCSAGHD